MRVLSTSPRKCTVTGIDNHEIPGLDLEKCAAQVDTNHGIVNLIMNEYAYYRRGHSIHSSGQIEWYMNTVDDKSVQVGGEQRKFTIDEYSIPLVCKGGLMHLEPQGIPTDKDLQTYSSVHLTSPHEWDPSVFDNEQPEDNGDPDLANVTENDAQHTFKAPCCCFENPLNTDLLFFEQSTLVWIVG